MSDDNANAEERSVLEQFRDNLAEAQRAIAESGFVCGPDLLLNECARLRPHYQTNSSTDHARRQLLDHFEDFARSQADPALPK